MLSNFDHYLSSADFFQNQVFNKEKQEHFHSVKQFGSRSGSVEPDLDPNRLQRLSSDDEIRLWQAKSIIGEIRKKCIDYHK